MWNNMETLDKVFYPKEFVQEVSLFKQNTYY